MLHAILTEAKTEGHSYPHSNLPSFNMCTNLLPQWKNFAFDTAYPGPLTKRRNTFRGVKNDSTFTSAVSVYIDALPFHHQSMLYFYLQKRVS